MEFGAEAGELRVLTEEALILAAVAGACVLLVLGVLELVWPTRPHRSRRTRAEAAPPRPILAPPPPPSRPVQSILPRRLIDSPSARPTGGFAFPPPADYVAPPLPRQEIRPIRPPEPATAAAPAAPAPVEQLEVPSFLQPIEEPSEPAYVPPPADVAPAPVEHEPPRIVTAPPAEAKPFEAEPPEIERVSERPRIELVATSFEPEPPRVDAAPPVEIDPSLVEIEPSRVEPERRLIVELEPASAQSSSTPPVSAPPPVEPAPPALEPPLLPEPPEPKPAPLEHAPPPFEPEPPPIEPEPPTIEHAPPIVLGPATAEQVAPPAEEATPPAAEPSAPPRRRRRSKVSPHARPHRVLRPAPPQYGGPQPPPAGFSTPVSENAGASPIPGGSTDAASPVQRDSPLVERCFALYQEKRFDEVVTIAEDALTRGRADAIPRETAALWSVVGLAKQGLGDDDGAHAALESSIATAPDNERPTYRRHLATLALDAAQARTARAGSHDVGDRMAVIRMAIVWTERGLAAVPWDPGLIDAREAAHDALWQAYEQAATSLLQRQEFTGARQLLREALDDLKLPPARAAGFRGLLSGTFGGEIGQLTAQAILNMQDGRESEALGTLRRAEELLETIPPDSLPSTRRDEVDQRLWWGYAELGSRRLDAGDYEEALDPLVHALRFTSIGADRQAETRAAVVRTLEGIAAVRALSIRRLAEAGNRDEAIVAAGELHALVKRGVELGLSEDELTAAFARVRRLCEELGMDTRA
jgi:tetratricopeptide (TPR) repeat protein